MTDANEEHEVDDAEAPGHGLIHARDPKAPSKLAYVPVGAEQEHGKKESCHHVKARTGVFDGTEEWGVLVLDRWPRMIRHGVPSR
jgi:hypothetical protein